MSRNCLSTEQKNASDCSPPRSFTWLICHCSFQHLCSPQCMNFLRGWAAIPTDHGNLSLWLASCLFLPVMLRWSSLPWWLLPNLAPWPPRWAWYPVADILLLKISRKKVKSKKWIRRRLERLYFTAGHLRSEKGVLCSSRVSPSIGAKCFSLSPGSISFLI